MVTHQKNRLATPSPPQKKKTLAPPQTQPPQLVPNPIFQSSKWLIGSLINQMPGRSFTFSHYICLQLLVPGQTFFWNFGSHHIALLGVFSPAATIKDLPAFAKREKNMAKRGEESYDLDFLWYKCPFFNITKNWWLSLSLNSWKVVLKTHSTLQITLVATTIDPTYNTLRDVWKHFVTNCVDEIARKWDWFIESVEWFPTIIDLNWG